jgi:hypothetical protein
MGREVGDSGAKNEKNIKKIHNSTISCERRGMSYSENTSTPVGFSTSTRLPLKISLKLNSFSPKRKLQGKAQRQLKRSNFKSIFLLDIIQLSLDPAINFYTFHSLLNCRNTTNNDFINWLFELCVIQTTFTKKKKKKQLGVQSPHDQTSGSDDLHQCEVVSKLRTIRIVNYKESNQNAS